MMLDMRTVEKEAAVVWTSARHAGACIVLLGAADSVGSGPLNVDYGLRHFKTWHITAEVSEWTLMKLRLTSCAGTTTLLLQAPANKLLP